jgi:hypothetical protein
MSLPHLRTVWRSLSAVVFAIPLFNPYLVRGDQWPADFKFASCECDVQEANDRPCYCPPPCCAPPCDYGYCYDCPLSDELAARLTPVMKSMQAQGITYAPGLTQFYQGDARGGREQEFDYGGKVDQFLILDTTKMGLWDGMTMTMHAETRIRPGARR